MPAVVSAGSRCARNTLWRRRRNCTISGFLFLYHFRVLPACGMWARSPICGFCVPHIVGLMPPHTHCSHTTSISRRGELYAWGLSGTGELGLGRWSPVEVSAPRQASLYQVRIVSVSCGKHHTLAIAEHGSLW